jgi:hypothetical protein
MAFYTYVSNVSPSDGFDRIDILLDNGARAGTPSWCRQPTV